MSTLSFVPLDHQLNDENGVFPCAIACPDSVTTVAEATHWIKQHQHDLELELYKCGALLFRGFPIDSAETFDAFSGAFNYPSFTYQESLSNAVRINFTKRVFTANEAPKDVEIFLHHEMAQTPLSPDKLFFFCQSAAETGGATPICRSDMLFAALREADPAVAEEFRNKGVKYTTHMPAADDSDSGQGRSWKSTLSVDTSAEAESKLKELGYSWEWQDDGSLRAVTPVLPAVRTLRSGVEVFYNQLIAAYLGWQGVRENPSSALTFGDDSHISIATLDMIVDLATQFTFDVPWQDGDVALIDNKLTMHGRRPFGGERKRQVLVALAA